MSEILALQAALYCQQPNRLSFGECRTHLARLEVELRKTDFAEYRVNFFARTGVGRLL